MIFCKLLAGTLLVGGIAQASYCFDVTSLIKNQITSQTQTEEKMLSINAEKAVEIKEKITKKQQAIITVESEIEAKYKESEKKLSQSTISWLFSGAKKSIPELTESLKEENKLAEAAKAAAELIQQDIDAKKADLEKTQAEIDDSNTSWFKKASHSISALKQKAVIAIKEQQLSWQMNTENTAKENVANTTETLKIENVLQEKRNKKNDLIRELQSEEESLEE